MSDDALRQLLPLVRRVALRLVRRLPASIEADDMVQAGLIAVAAALPRYDPARGASLETFAARRALGGMLDELRRGGLLSRSEWRARRAPPEVAWPEGFDPPDPASGPLAALLDRERAARLEAEIARLPARARGVLRLLLDGDLTQREVGCLFGLSEARVGTLAAETVALLAARLADKPVRVSVPGADGRVGRAARMARQPKGSPCC